MKKIFSIFIFIIFIFSFTFIDNKKETSITVENSKKYAPHIFTKSGFMVGLGETEEEIRQLLKDLRGAGVDLITIGQYLAPSKNHYPVARYPEPEEYKRWEEYALSLGFKGVASGPLVRSSYRAGALYQAACLQAKCEQIKPDKV